MITFLVAKRKKIITIRKTIVEAKQFCLKNHSSFSRCGGLFCESLVEGRRQKIFDSSSRQFF